MNQVKEFSVFSNKNILIIGGQGFVGQAFIKKLSEIKCSVSIMDNHVYTKYRKVSHLKGDVTKLSDVQKAIKGKDIVIDLAALRPVESMQMPYDDLKVTAQGALHILNACNKYNRNCRVIFFGSSLEYGKVNKLPVSEENNVFNPDSLYGVHKLAVSHYSRIYYLLYGVKSTVLRFSHIYGPEIYRPGKRMSIVNLFLHQSLRGKELNVFGKGSQMRDFLYIDDALRAVDAALTSKEASGQAFNIGSGKPYSIQEIAMLIVKITGKGRIVKKNWPEPYQKIEQGNYYTDFSKAKKVLGWRPLTDVEEGIKRAVEIIRNESTKS